MRRVLWRNVSLYTCNYLSSPASSIPKPKTNPTLTFSGSRNFRFFSSDGESSEQKPADSSDPTPKLVPETNSSDSESKDVSTDVEDVSNQVMKTRLEKYFDKGEEEALPEIMEAIFARSLTKKHEETDDELVEELEFQPMDDVSDGEFESDFEELHDTDEDVPNLYSAADIVKQRLHSDPYFNMDDKKWNELVTEAVEMGITNDTKECAAILEDMLKWDSLLPDDMKRKVEAKFNELGEKCEKNELEPEEAYKLFKEFEDEIVNDYLDKKEAEELPQLTEGSEQLVKVVSCDPPGEGPVLRWQTRAVFGPGDDAWHPKNRKVKLSVTVKELGFSIHQFRRMREIVGKRYHPGKDELTIISERFEDREENRKDCLRTLLAIIEEAGKANKLAEDARVMYVKGRLKANPAFMARLQAKTKVGGLSCSSASM